ncbi:TPA: GNAT family N-acetyltransferase, partial [Clostridioides difficile]|nr:GNAT family N-acetyltransferase [Clostridioides difficile]
MIRKANMNDLESIMKIIKSTVEEMKTYNNTQWDENYPLEKDFVSDI